MREILLRERLRSRGGRGRDWGCAALWVAAPVLHHEDLLSLLTTRSGEWGRLLLGPALFDHLDDRLLKTVLGNHSDYCRINRYSCYLPECTAKLIVQGLRE